MRFFRRRRRSSQERLVDALVLVGLAVFFALTYLVVVLGGGLVIGQTDSPNGALSIVATVTVALAANPVAEWLQARFTRLVNEGRPSSYDVLSRFSASVSDQRDADSVPASIAQVLAEGTGAAWAQVWLWVDGRLDLAATWPASSAAQSAGVPRGQPHHGQRELAVTLGGETLGILRLQEEERRPLTPVEQRLFTGLAAQAGPALRGVRLRRELSWRLDQLSERAVELRESRQRLVDAHDRARRDLERDIHDGAQQHLVALTVNLRLASTIAATSPERSATVLSEQADAAAEAIATLVDLSRGIYPRSLTEHGIGAALSAAVDASPVPVRVADGLGGRRAGTDVEVAVYFCCLEAIQNAVKHSGATEVAVLLEVEKNLEVDLLGFTVLDDGDGPGPAVAGVGGGLQNMRDRIDSVGGSLQLGPGADGGFQVTGVVPFEPTDEAAR